MQSNDSRQQDVQQELCRGRVSVWNSDRGFGFLMEENTAKVTFKQRLFFHFTQWLNDSIEPRVGQIVTFLIGPGKNPGQTQALQITVVGSLPHVNPRNGLSALPTAIGLLAEKDGTQEAK
jgi:cold shock CspA family protein